MARSRSPSPEVTTTTTTTAFNIQTAQNDDKQQNKRKSVFNRKCCLVCGLSFVIIFSLINAGFLLLDYLLITSKKGSSSSSSSSSAEIKPWNGNYSGIYLTDDQNSHFCDANFAPPSLARQSLAFRFAMSEELIRIRMQKINEDPYNATPYRPEAVFEFSSKPPNRPTFIRKVLFSSGTPFRVTLHDWKFSQVERGSSSINGSVIPQVTLLVNVTIRGPTWREVYSLESEEMYKTSPQPYQLIVKRHFVSQDRLTASYQDAKNHSYCKEFTRVAI